MLDELYPKMDSIDYKGIFTLKIEDELEGSHYEIFVVKNQNGTESLY